MENCNNILAIAISGWVIAAFVLMALVIMTYYYVKTVDTMNEIVDERRRGLANTAWYYETDIREYYDDEEPEDTRT